MSYAGDWMCGTCQHINFKKRESCQRCGFSKYNGQAEAEASAYQYNSTNRTSEVLAGDWYCQAMNCGAHNYASRTSCFRCGSQKPDHDVASSGYHGSRHDMIMSSASYGSEVAPPGWKIGDWICTRPGCGVHNYACRIECFKCKTPKDTGGMY